jgi:hypothetical protein
MATAYRFAWFAVLDDKGASDFDKATREAGLPADGGSATRPVAIYIIYWTDRTMRLGLESRDEVKGSDPSLHIRVVGPDGDKDAVIAWLNAPGGMGEQLRGWAKVLQLIEFNAEVLQ